MAATAATVNVICIPYSGGVGDAHSELLASGNGADFTLNGGKYGVTVDASTYGTVTLQRKTGVGNYVAAMTAFSANGYASADLAPGLYRISLG